MTRLHDTSGLVYRAERLVSFRVRRSRKVGECALEIQDLDFLNGELQSFNLLATRPSSKNPVRRIACPPSSRSPRSMPLQYCTSQCSLVFSFDFLRLCV